MNRLERASLLAITGMLALLIGLSLAAGLHKWFPQSESPASIVALVGLAWVLILAWSLSGIRR